MNLHSRLKRKADDLFRSAEEAASEPGQETIRERLREARGRLDGERLCVVVCGEWRRGKSSLINMLLEEEELCPTGGDVTTAVVTMIQYAEQPRYTALVGEPGKETAVDLKVRDQIKLYASEKFNPGNAKQARLLLIELPNLRLREGLIIVDTPGVGGALARHTDITYAFLPKADAVLFVTDPSALTVPELDFVKLIDRHCKHVLFAVTKMDGDAGRKAAPVIAGNRAKLGEALNRPASAVNLLPVSSSTKQDFLASRDERDLADSGFPVLERELWGLLGANRGRIMLASALVKLDRAVEDLRTPMAAELVAATEQDQQKLQAMKAEYEQASRRLGELQESGAGWRGLMADGLTAVRREADQELAAGFREIRRRSDRYLKDDAFLRAPEQIPSMIETDVDALLADLQAVMEGGAGELHARLEKVAGLGLSRAVVGELAIDAPGFSFNPASVERLDTMSRSLTVGREMMFNAGGGAAFFGLLGAVVGGISGALAGLLGGPAGVVAGAIAGAKLGGGLGGVGGFVAGKAHGLKSSFRKIREADRAAVSQKLAPEVRHFVEDCEAAARNVLGVVQAGLAEAMKNEFNKRIREERSRVEEVIARIKQAKSRSAADNASRVRALKTGVARLDGIRAETAKTAEEVLRVGGVEPVAPAQPPADQRIEGRPADTGDWADE